MNLHRDAKIQETAAPLDLVSFCEQPFSEKNGIVPESLDMSVVNAQNTEEISVEEEARRIYESGQALEYMEAECHRHHVGDDQIIRGCILSFAETHVVNGNGIHVEVNGERGSGKTHSTKTVGDILPPDMIRSGQFSDMALFYDKTLKPGTVIRMDDQSTSDQFQEIMKARTSEWLEPFIKYTVKNDRTGGERLEIPPRCPQWTSIKNSTSDDQTLDRVLVFHADESSRQRKRIEALNNWKDMHPKETQDTHCRDVCRAIFSKLPDVYVKIPFADRIECAEKESTRTKIMVKSLTKAAAVLRAPKRQYEEEDMILATEDDFKVATAIMNPILKDIGGSQINHLSPKQIAMINYMKENGNRAYPNKEFQNNLGLEDYEVTRAINGVRPDGSDGLSKVPGITKGKVCGFNYNSELKELIGVEFVREIYDRWDASKGMIVLRQDDLE